MDNNQLYSMCECGSGKKYKFCCYKKDKENYSTHSLREMFEEKDQQLLINSFERAEVESIKGRQLLNQNDLISARRIFKDNIKNFPNYTPDYNNLAMCEFHLNNIEEAIKIEENVINRLDANNLFAFAQLVHYYCLLGKRGKARLVANRLKKNSRNIDISPDYYFKLIEAYARMNDHQAIIDLLNSGGEDSLDQMCFYYIAIAFANLNRFDEAIIFINKVDNKTLKRFHTSKDYKKKLNNRKDVGTLYGNWYYFSFAEWLPATFFSLLEKAPNDNPYDMFGDFKEELLLNMLDLFDKDVEMSIQLLATCASKRSTEILKKILFGQYKNDSVRLQCISILQENDLLSNDDYSTKKVFLTGEWQKLSNFKQIKVYEDTTYELSRKDQDKYEKAMDYYHKDKYPNAEKLLKELIKNNPDFGMAYNNCATIMMKLGREKDAIELLKRSLENAPDYLFSRASLATYYLFNGEPKLAREIVFNFEIPKKVSANELGAIHLAQSKICKMEGKNKEANIFLKDAERLAPELPGIDEMKELLKVKGYFNLVKKLFNKNKKKDRKTN